VKLLSRYVLFEILSFFSISLAAFTGLLLTLRMLQLTSLIINRGVEISQIAKVFVSIVPTFLELALPMSTLLGVMLAFARMCGDSEVVVMRASGISLASFLKPIAAFGISVGVAGLIVSCILRPWGFDALSRALFEIARSKSVSGLTEGVFNKLGEITLYADTVNYQTGELTRVLVDDKRDAEQRKVVIAKRGKIVADDASRSISLLLADGVAHETLDGRYSRTEFNSNSLTVDPNEIKSETRKGLAVRELGMSRLREAIQEYKAILRGTDADQLDAFGETLTRPEVEKKFRRAKIEYGQRVSLPIASTIMAFIGMALGIMSPRTQRTWGAGFAATLGLVVFIIYYSIFSVGVALADSGHIHVGVALWAPNVVATGIAAFLVRKITTEKWQSVSGGIQQAIATRWERLRGRRAGT